MRFFLVLKGRVKSMKKQHDMYVVKGISPYSADLND
jgi:hypothetical protein